MRITVTCPICKKTGTLPDAMRGLRITCARCHQPFVVPAPEAAAKASVGSLAAMLEEDEAANHVGLLPLAPTRRSTQQAPAHPTPLAAYAGIAIGGVCALLLAVVTVRVLPGDPQHQGKPQPSADQLAEPGWSEEKSSRTPPVPEPEGRSTVAQRKKAIEDATVYLKLSRGGRLMGSGSGFVIRVDKDAVIVATNRHVADAATDDGGKPEITAVFRSGQGSTLEQSLPAEIVAIDHSREMNHDLAILRVRGLHQADRSDQAIGSDRTDIADEILGLWLPVR